MKVPVPDDVALRLRALQLRADALPIELLELRRRAQQDLLHGRTVDLATIDRVLVAAEALREQLEAAMPPRTNEAPEDPRAPRLRWLRGGA